MILPERLKKGDTVGVIAPASPPNQENLEKAIPFLNSLGLHVALAPNLTKTYGYLAGTDQERLDDLHQMFGNPAIKGIFCACGGYGTGRLVSSIDYELIKRNPKVFWGYSDITYLHTAIRQRTGLVTFHGPMLSSDIGKDDFDQASRLMFHQLFNPEALHYTEKFTPLKTIADGEARGEIVGGNLSLLINTLGTAFELDTKEKLLLIEDIGEEPYRVDSFLNQLSLSGKLDDAAGIIVGDFSDAEPKKPEQSLSLEEVFNHYFSKLKKPVLSGFKIGHCLPHFAIPLGTSSLLSSETKTLRIDSGVA